MMNGASFELVRLFCLCALTVALAAGLYVLTFVASCRFHARLKREKRRDDKTILVAFFHPHCSSGGGGERVLWKIVEVLLRQQIQSREKFGIEVVIYTVEESSPTFREDLLKHVRDRFCIDLTQQETSSCLNFIHLSKYRQYLLPAKRLSLVVESLNTMRLAWKAMTFSWDLVPDIFIDTTGCAFTYLVANLCMGCQVWAYVHYPTISTDMLQLVWEQRRTAYNHSAHIAQSKLATYAKLIYYSLFAVLYGFAGSLAAVVLVNSTWTYNHIRSLWKLAAWKSRIVIVYPPCQVEDLQKTHRPDSIGRQNVILSIGQFRPEKDHLLQIETLSRLHNTHPEWRGRIKLVLLGSCRGEADQERLQHLQSQARKSGLIEGQDIEFVVNVPFPVVRQWLAQASMGIHTMWNEHFGIGIVEMMAAGLIVLAHNSGGPKSDIVCDTDEDDKRTGFLASTADEYAELIHRILAMEKTRLDPIRARAQRSALRFSDQVFEKSMERVIFTNLKQLRE